MCGDMLNDEELMENFELHKQACRKANVRPMSLRKFVMTEMDR